MLLMEALGYNRFGCRCISREEMEAKKKFVLSSDPLSEVRNFHKPLESYQDGKKSLDELVEARHQDEVERLTKKYQDFFKFPESHELRAYRQQKEEMDKDYENQKVWLGFYHSDNQRATRALLNKSTLMFIGSVFLVAGTMNACTKSPLAPFVASLFYAGAVFNFYGAYVWHPSLKSITKDKERIKMVLEDWHKDDRFARYDRVLLNDKLKALDKKRPTQIRRDKKRTLVAQYRSKHPKVRV